MVEHDDLGLVLSHRRRDFLQLSAANEGARVRHIPGAHDIRYRVAPGREHQLLKFAGILPLGFTGKIEVHEHSAFTRIGTIKKQYDLGVR